MTEEVQRPSRLSRRRFLRLVGLGAGTLAAGGCGIVSTERREALSPASGIAEYELVAAPVSLRLGGREVSTWGYNEGLPGPEIRIKEGQTLRATVVNRLPEDTTIHWHGVPLPNEMDGVPDVTQPAIAAGESFTYEFVAEDPGSYIYHSHVGSQLDRGLYGPLIVEPAEETLSYDKEFVVSLDDWLDGMPGTPEDAFETLKSGGGAMSSMEGMSDMDMSGTSETESIPGASGESGDVVPAESPPDLVYPMYLVNGKPAEEPEEFEVRKGDRVRFRLINPSASTIYRVALEGHRMTVTHTDGQPVEPVEADVIRIGMGERYDVLVNADNHGVWQLGAQAEGTDDIARAILRYEGSSGEAPPPSRKPPELGGQMLLYSMLQAKPEANAPPEEELDEVVPVSLEGDEERYVWTINGEVFSEADEIAIGRDRHVRFEFENKTMMPHPMHLHGHFFRVDNGTDRGPIKDTVLVEPMQRLNIDWVSNNPGGWAFHCHNIYHQEAGMMRVVRVV